ncbi:DNA-binding IclR family transcriptional regulator [Actinoplanes campanulatus]|uniref:Glycerol operon regulatory protein n=1 Tax=Actinoplanes campanulatus TaxID=113559 RepID=A0A7W5AFH4_9ACTN|nr:IclR family transcriptional regulator [Actinoplanes campanulatus]MBB3095371.1 DNA-binding IclR family transcriptional regulator [Actinoplanes campanulatus]GGN41757.1 IclR family transcriptional regulator [Actinoplanes campanulatus]GID34975.1 IclR family transcriptional regulator [Actinoplanes campanulatus]
MSNESEPGPALVQSVDRALSILEILARRRSAGVTEIGRELGVHKSTAFRLLAVLESRGFVEQTQERGTYRLGLGVVRLAGAVAAQLDLSRQGHEVCDRLAADLGETVNIAILDGSRVVNITQSRGAASVTSYNWVGRQTPPHATSSGKVLLAFAPEPVRAAVLAEPLERFTPATLTGGGELIAELDAVRSAGWGSTSEEYEVGLNAVAAPIRGADGSVVAALSVSGPAYRLDRAAFPEIAKRVIVAAGEVSGRMGFMA